MTPAPSGLKSPTPTPKFLKVWLLSSKNVQLHRLRNFAYEELIPEGDRILVQDAEEGPGAGVQFFFHRRCEGRHLKRWEKIVLILVKINFNIKYTQKNGGGQPLNIILVYWMAVACTQHTYKVFKYAIPSQREKRVGHVY